MTGQRTTPLSDQQARRVKKMRESGMTISEIAKYFSCSPEYIARRILKEPKQCQTKPLTKQA